MNGGRDGILDLRPTQSPVQLHPEFQGEKTGDVWCWLSTTSSAEVVNGLEL
jgi:hypothetical protein